ncbi:MAG: T9SS type A sorting domain-containing protein [Mariniphaga sp.]|nr:T9SS type A sorting domain-containing protein [Mariniphaga sp.]
MKKLLSIFIIILTLNNVQSQEIELTFQATGAATTIDSIKATNMVTGESNTVSGTNTLLLSSISTASRTITGNSGENKIYPNPFNEHAILQYASTEEDNIDIMLINSSGQIVAKSNQNIVPGLNRFNISVNTKGIYLVSIIGEAVITTLKMVCLQNSNNKNQIEYTDFSSEVIKEKSNTLEEGDLFHFMVYSSEFITIIADTPTESKTYDVEFIECKDNDGKSYAVVQIGEQWWMAENLKVTHYRSGEAIPNITDTLEWVNLSSGAYCNYDNDVNNVTTYGRLYNWHALDDNRNIAPAGWHVPTDAEWQILVDYLGGYAVAGGKMKATGTVQSGDGLWYEPNLDATNESGFSALPGGYRSSNDGNCYELIGTAYFWLATESINNLALRRGLAYYYSGVHAMNADKEKGFSVRCVRD